MKLQIALDEIELIDALILVEKVKKTIDIIEIGTPFIIKEGMRAVREFRQHFPDKKILADTKIMDGGEGESEMAFQAGADYVTVLGVTDVLTVKACLNMAQKYKKQVVVDMICVKNVEEKVTELEAIGVTHIAVHTGVDQQAAGRTPLDDLAQMKKYSKKSLISVAGGINIQTLSKYKELGADIIIVGGGIAHAKDPAKKAKAIYNEMKGE